MSDLGDVLASLSKRHPAGTRLLVLRSSLPPC